jgi:acyl-[acyl-carrier-protein]-phospholipid O-acyltransferase/long-chain-fatty-acid--[acyl-carrier-protein] ligase
MAGYLRAENPGVLEPLEDGWHDTGDIVTFDEDGFITIRGRAKRFAKIAGEMVSLAAVEQLAGDLWPESMTAVATLPDARKGERLVMVTNAPKATRKEFMNYVKSRKTQDLMIPSDVYVMNSIPVLGAGKVDFVGVQKLVTEGIDKKLAV